MVDAEAGTVREGGELLPPGVGLLEVIERWAGLDPHQGLSRTECPDDRTPLPPDPGSFDHSRDAPANA